MPNKMTVHWAQGDVLDFGEYFAIEAIYQVDDGPLQKASKTSPAYLCNAEEEKLDIVLRHFKTSIEPFEVPHR